MYRRLCTSKIIDGIFKQGPVITRDHTQPTPCTKVVLFFVSLSSSPLFATSTDQLARSTALPPFSCLGKDTVELTHPELSCHLCHLGLQCVCRVCAPASPWAGTVLWEVTVNMHKLGCAASRFHHRLGDMENMTNALGCMCE